MITKEEVLIMHDGPGAAIGTFIVWFGMLGLAVLVDYITDIIKEKIRSSEGTDKRVKAEKVDYNNYIMPVEYSQRGDRND